jgi:hypothetical protein
VDINVVNTAASIYQGAMYVGESPLTLRLPLDRLEYVAAETARGEEAKAVFITPDMPGETRAINLIPMRSRSGEKRVNRARSRAYWAWGGVWITGITAWVTYGIYSGQLEALASSSSNDFFRSTEQMYYVSIGAIGLLGVAIVHNLVQMPLYLHTASQGATPIVRQEKVKK